MLLARMAYDVINDYDRGRPIGGLIPRGVHPIAVSQC